MGRKLRGLLAESLVEVTNRTVQSRFLMRPSSEANLAIKGTLGRAQRYTGLRVVACVFLSNHYHLLVVPETEQQLASFMRFLNTNVSKQLGRLHGWSGPMFQRRYEAIPVSHQEEAQVGRLRYLLEHGVKEGLVARPEEWPGVHCVSELSRGYRHLWGIWQERTAIWKAKQRGRSLPPNERITREKLELSPLPVWEGLSAERRRDAVRELVSEIEGRYRTRRAARSSKPLGERAIRAQNPHAAPRATKRSPAPVAHAATRDVWLSMKAAYREFVSAYREAAQRSKEGRMASFPPGCFPPTGAFVARAGPS
jgi:REP element-mobilizing transposase RayT